MVILNLDLSDLHDDIEYSKHLQLDPNGVPTAAFSDPSEASSDMASSALLQVLADVKDMLKQHSRLYNTVRFRLYLYSEQQKRSGKRSGDLRYDKLALVRSNYQNRGDSDWVLTFKYLRLIRDTLQSRNIDFWVTIYPYGIQVSGKEWAEGRKFWGFEPDSVYSMWPQERLERFCREQGIAEVINMCDDFKNASSSRPLYHIFDGHWTDAGHELAARIILRRIRPFLAAKSVLRSEAIVAHDAP